MALPQAPTTDPREAYWLKRFTDAAQNAEAAAENAVNIYTRHGWLVRQNHIRRKVRSLLTAGAVPPGARTVDLGCGSGAYCRLLAELGLEVTGTDLCQASLDYAAAHSPPAIRYRQANGLDLPFPDGSFDLAISIGVMQHITDTPRFLREFLRILRPGGTGIIMTLNRNTVLEVVRRRLPSLWRKHALLQEEVRLRRFSCNELRRGVRAVAPAARVAFTPVFVFPRRLAVAERLLAGLGPAGAAAFPLAIDLMATVSLAGAGALGAGRCRPG
ncbi:MAG: class I SAM-dependent methyltransferase [Lentisphaeria bacterium]